MMHQRQGQPIAQTEGDTHLAPTDRMTVAICTYNNARVLDRALAALEQQRGPSAAWSTLIVDNNCTDDTAELITGYIERGRIPGLRRVVEKQQGLAYARRRAIAETGSPWLAFIDDDCFLEPDWVAQALAFCGAHPRAGAVGGRVRLAWEIEPDDVIARHRTSYAEQDYGDSPCPVLPDGKVTHLVGAGLIVQRQAMADCGWLESMALTGRRGNSLTAGEDTEIVFRIRNAGYELWYNPAMVAHHFIARARMSVPYLCRLQRGFGQSRPITKSMRFNRRPTPLWRLRVLCDRIGTFGRLCRSIVLHHVLPRQPLSPDQRIGFHFRLGELEGAVHFLLRGYRL